MAVKEPDRGFLLLQFQNRYFYYKVCPFGAVLSAHYWARLGGALLTIIPHALFLGPCRIPFCGRSPHDASSSDDADIRKHDLCISYHQPKFLSHGRNAN